MFAILHSFYEFCCFRSLNTFACAHIVYWIFCIQRTLTCKRTNKAQRLIERIFYLNLWIILHNSFSGAKIESMIRCKCIGDKLTLQRWAWLFEIVYVCVCVYFILAKMILILSFPFNKLYWLIWFIFILRFCSWWFCDFVNWVVSLCLCLRLFC